MRMGLEEGQKWDNTAAPTNTLIEVATTQRLWNTLHCGSALMWLTLIMTKYLAPSHHTRIHPIQPPNSTLSSLFTLKLKPLAFCPFHNTYQPSLFGTLHALFILLKLKQPMKNCCSPNDPIALKQQFSLTISPCFFQFFRSILSNTTICSLQKCVFYSTILIFSFSNLQG